MFEVVLFDWSDKNAGYAVAVGFDAKLSEKDANCFCVGNPENWYDWDLSILMEQGGFKSAEIHNISVIISQMWRERNKLRVKML